MYIFDETNPKVKMTSEKKNLLAMGIEVTVLGKGLDSLPEKEGAQNNWWTELQNELSFVKLIFSGACLYLLDSRTRCKLYCNIVL